MGGNRQKSKALTPEAFTSQHLRLAGTGFGVIYITCFSVVGAWFQQKRALATGTVVCGTGVGLAIIGVVGPLLLRAYSWRGALVVFACIVLQGCVCGAAFRPAELHQRILREDEVRRARKEAKRKEKAAAADQQRGEAREFALVAKVTRTTAKWWCQGN